MHIPKFSFVLAIGAYDDTHVKGQAGREWEQELPVKDVWNMRKAILLAVQEKQD